MSEPTANELARRGLEKQAAGDLAAAATDFDAALAGPASAAVCYHNRATARHHLGDLDGALADFGAALAAAPPAAAARIVHGRVAVHVARLDFAAAAADCDAAIRLDPGFALAYV